MKTENKSFYDYIEECAHEFCADQAGGEIQFNPDEVFIDIARSIVDSGMWRDEGFSAQDVREFCRVYGITFR